VARAEDASHCVSPTGVPLTASPVVARAEELTFDTVEYDNEKLSLRLTDLDRLEGRAEDSLRGVRAAGSGGGEPGAEVCASGTLSPLSPTPGVSASGTADAQQSVATPQAARGQAHPPLQTLQEPILPSDAPWVCFRSGGLSLEAQVS
jgi:hypothetical protein